MIKRPLNARFREAVLADVKTTTIRDNPWPVGVPIMLYSWSGAPYRSKQIDVAPVVVTRVWTIRITHFEDGEMVYILRSVLSDVAHAFNRPLHDTEGFASRDDMDDWFRAKVKRGETVEKALMAFWRATE